MAVRLLQKYGRCYATHELGGPVLDEVGDVVDTELQNDGLRRREGGIRYKN
jgi:hypothetical protein